MGTAGCLSLPPAEHPPEPESNATPYSEELELGRQAFAELLKSARISHDGRLVILVERVGHRLAAVSSAPELEWEFMLVESQQPNAFALPGGKVAVSTHLLLICANEAGLAAVLGHVIGHAIARHGMQRLPPQILLTGDTGPVPLANHADRENILEALGLGFEPFSREDELAADKSGMILMARAGYDPREAARFWQRFHAMTRGADLPQILVAHPLGPNRIENIKRFLRATTPIYRRNPNQHGLGESFLYILNRRKLDQRRQATPGG